MGTASARPERLTNLAETAVAIVEALRTRAGWLTDEWDAYEQTNGAAWRFDFSDLPGAITAWAGSLGNIGEWTGRVGEAFLAADSDDPGGRHELDEARLHALMPCDARRFIDDSDADDTVDWGDPDDPPAWLEALDFTAMAIGHAGSGVDAVDVSYVVGTGTAARWSPATPAVLGRFASASGFARFADVLGGGSAGLSGLSAGLDQWQDDAGTLNFTDGEVAARATARGTATGLAALGGSTAGGSIVTTTVCVSSGPVCAGIVIIGVGLFASGVADRLVDWVMPSPAPAEHDPELVTDEIEDVPPTALLRDIPDSAWEVMEPIHDAGDDAGQAAFDSRHPYLDPGALHQDPNMIERYDLPLAWVDDHMTPLYGPQWVARYEAFHLPAERAFEITPEMSAALDRYEVAMEGA